MAKIPKNLSSALDEITEAKKKKPTFKEYIADANSDARSAKDADDNLEQISLRLHPDVIEAIKKAARSDRKNFAETMRDVITSGMRTKGITLPEIPV